MKSESDRRRHLDLEGAYNVRDTGGYSTVDGRQTRWRTFFRADSLHMLTPGDRSILVGCGIRTVIDLRRTAETREAPNVFNDSSGVAYIHQDAFGSDPIHYDEELVSSEEPATRVAASYTAILDQRKSQIGRTLATLATPGILPAMVHCVGGQDRTGRITALILGLAGVPRETIVEDYALSARYVVKWYLDENPNLSASDYTWQYYQAEFCPPEAMLKTLDHLDRHYGGIEEYVRSTGLTTGQIERIRCALVE